MLSPLPKPTWPTFSLFSNLCICWTYVVSNSRREAIPEVGCLKSNMRISRVQQSLKAWGSHSKMQYALREVLFVLRKHVSFGRCIRCCPGSSRLTAYAFYQKATFPFQHFPEDCRAPFKQVICVLSEAVFKEVQFSKQQHWVRDAAFPKK